MARSQAAVSAVEHFDFDAEEAEAEPSATFTLGGRVWTLRNRDQVPYNRVEAILGLSDTDNARKDVKNPFPKGTPEFDQFEANIGSMVRVGPFFADMLVPDQVDDFLALLRAPNSPITLDKLPKLMNYISEKVLNRPTEPSKSSTTGRQRTKAGSRASSSSRVTQPKASAG